MKIFCRDGSQGLPEHAPYDKILASAAASADIPRAWRDQLKVRGKIVAPVAGSIWLFVKTSKSEWTKKEFPGFAFVPLVQKKELGIRNYELGGRNRKKKKQGFVLASLPVALGCGLALATLLFFSEVYRPHAAYRGIKTIEIAPGMGSRAIGDLLTREGVIRSKWTFVAYISLRGHASSLKPGAYAFGNAAIPEISKTLVQGVENERAITIPEGWSLNDIGQYFEGTGIMTRREFDALTNADGRRQFRERFGFLADAPARATLEGYLFPDTYRVFKNASKEDIIAKMLENFERRVAPDTPGEVRERKKSLFEIITLASLIEKEVTSDADRALVSGILRKRLDAGIPLQVDATIVYIKRARGERLNSNRVSLDDLRIKSPYNTYLSLGLPPGPIANPGLSAIRAALNPQSSAHLYYLSALDGRTIFSRTLEEHNLAKARYLP